MEQEAFPPDVIPADEPAGSAEHLKRFVDVGATNESVGVTSIPVDGARRDEDRENAWILPLNSLIPLGIVLPTTGREVPLSLAGETFTGRVYCVEYGQQLVYIQKGQS